MLRRTLKAAGEVTREWQECFTESSTTQWDKHKYLEGSLRVCPSNQTIEALLRPLANGTRLTGPRFHSFTWSKSQIQQRQLVTLVAVMSPFYSWHILLGRKILYQVGSST